jgi:hypothetical protein
MYNRSSPQLTFFCELDAAALTDLFADPQLIPALRSLGASVSLGIIDLSPERAAVVRQLNAAGVPVTGWQLLPRDEGYWYNLDNAPQAAARYAAFGDWSRANGLCWQAIGVDVEPDIREMARVAARPLQLVPLAARRLLDPARLCRAAAQYAALLAQMRADGYPVESYIFSFVLDERRAGATLLQHLSGLVDLPVDREVPMIYTNFMRPRGDAILASYAPELRAVALGITGGGVDVADIQRVPPLTWDELSRDLRIAARWCDALYIFSLEGCVRQGFLPRLAAFDWNAMAVAPAWRLRRVRLARGMLWAGLWLSARPWLLLGCALGLLALGRWARPARRRR